MICRARVFLSINRFLKSYNYYHRGIRDTRVVHEDNIVERDAVGLIFFTRRVFRNNNTYIRSYNIARTRRRRQRFVWKAFTDDDTRVATPEVFFCNFFISYACCLKLNSVNAFEKGAHKKINTTRLPKVVNMKIHRKKKVTVFNNVNTDEL